MEGTKIILEAWSERGDADWYGDFNYHSNPLAHWSDSNFAKVICYGGSSHGFGTARIRVETTEEFVKLMGWDNDLKYKVKE